MFLGVVSGEFVIVFVVCIDRQTPDVLLIHFTCHGEATIAVVCFQPITALFVFATTESGDKKRFSMIHGTSSLLEE
jgi:hypothetical protein